MRREQLLHLIRAATRILDDPDIVVIGSQSILASYRDTALPDDVTVSIEADLLPLSGDVVDSDRIDGAIGEGSPFHQTFGVYGQGVDVTTAVCPPGWQRRLIPLRDPVSSSVGWCLDPHDLCAAKLVAHRPKDLEFVAAAVRHRLVDPSLVRERLEAIPNARVGDALGVIDRFDSTGIPVAERAQWRRQRDRAITQRRAEIDNAPPVPPAPSPGLHYER